MILNAEQLAQRIGPFDEILYAELLEWCQDFQDTLTHLQRQLADLEILHGTKKAFDAYVQQRVDEAVLAEAVWWADNMVDLDNPGAEATVKERLAAHRSRTEGKSVTPPSQPSRYPESYHRKLIHDFLPEQPAKEGSNRDKLYDSAMLDIITDRLIQEDIASGRLVRVISCPCCGYPNCGHNHTELFEKGGK